MITRRNPGRDPQQVGIGLPAPPQPLGPGAPNPSIGIHPPAPPRPGPDAPPGGGMVTPGGNRQGPTELQPPGLPRTPPITPRSQAAPGQAMEPVPVTTPPPPFEPMASPIQRRGGPPPQDASLLGQAGGLLGGGLNVPGAAGPAQDGSQLAALIAQLYQMANR